MFRLTDAHAHITSKEDLEERKEHSIVTLFSAGTPTEAKDTLTLAKETSGLFLPTCGLHPWHAAEYSTDEMLPYLMVAPIIGEIGMDSVWCDVPLALQEKVFRTQLHLACELKKPVILHTKGQERRIASILKEYPNRYLVHWYSAKEPPEAYLSLDCFFSIGPDVWWNPAVQKTASLAPLNRLLIETDGLEAVRWAYEAAPQEAREAFTKENLHGASSLFFTLQAVASLRNLSPREAGHLFENNLFHGFLSL